MSDFVHLGLLCMGLLPARVSNTSITVFHKLSAGSPPNLRSASKEIIFCFGAAVSNSCLLLSSPAYQYKCVATKNVPHSP